MAHVFDDDVLARHNSKEYAGLLLWNMLAKAVALCACKHCAGVLHLVAVEPNRRRNKLYFVAQCARCKHDVRRVIDTSQFMVPDYPNFDEIKKAVWEALDRDERIDDTPITYATTEVKIPCPICGGSIIHYNHLFSSVIVNCESCGEKMQGQRHVTGKETLQDSIDKAWKETVDAYNKAHDISNPDNWTRFKSKTNYECPVCGSTEALFYRGEHGDYIKCATQNCINEPNADLYRDSSEQLSMELLWINLCSRHSRLHHLPIKMIPLLADQGWDKYTLEDEAPYDRCPKCGSRQIQHRVADGSWDHVKCAICGEVENTRLRTSLLHNREDQLVNIRDTWRNAVDHYNWLHNKEDKITMESPTINCPICDTMMDCSYTDDYHMKITCPKCGHSSVFQCVLSHGPTVTTGKGRCMLCGNDTFTLTFEEGAEEGTAKCTKCGSTERIRREIKKDNDKWEPKCPDCGGKLKLVNNPMDPPMYVASCTQCSWQGYIKKPDEKKPACNQVEKDISEVCGNIEKMLLEKNAKYGNSALNPLRVFSNADTLEQIKVRMDDKLSRIKNQNKSDDEDAYMDLAGYLVLYMVARKEQNNG